MAISDPYCTRNELKSRVGVDDELDDLELDRAVASASRWIDEYCQRSFNLTASESRVLDATRSSLLRLGDYNDVVTVTSVKTDDNADGTFETTWAASDYQLLPIDAPHRPEPIPYREIRGVGARSFPHPSCSGRVGLVEVTGTWGWPSVPVAVKEATLIQANRIFKRRHSPEGLTGWGAEFGPVRLSVKADPDVERLLAPYRRTAVLVA